MPTYFDSGVLAKLYCLEPNTPQAAALVRAEQPPLPFTRWQELEIRNALRLKAFRGELTEAQLQQSLADLGADLTAGLFQRADLDAEKLFQVAEELSSQFALQTGCRTLDIVHVAAARGLGATDFVSLDARQRKLATLSGLRVRP